MKAKVIDFAKYKAKRAKLERIKALDMARAIRTMKREGIKPPYVVIVDDEPKMVSAEMAEKLLALL